MQSSKLIRSRSDAYSVLGIPNGSDEADIKKAYKNLVKLFHPDMASVEDDEVYTRVVEAYEYLCANPAPKNDPTPSQSKSSNVSKAQKPQSGPFSARPQTKSTTSTGKILGSPDQVYRTGSNRDSFERKYKEQRAQKAQEWDRQMEQYVAEQKRREEEYQRTMAAINAIRIAEAIKALVKDKD